MDLCEASKRSLMRPGGSTKRHALLAWRPQPLATCLPDGSLGITSTSSLFSSWTAPRKVDPWTSGMIIAALAIPFSHSTEKAAEVVWSNRRAGSPPPDNQSSGGAPAYEGNPAIYRERPIIKFDSVDPSTSEQVVWANREGEGNRSRRLVLNFNHYVLAIEPCRVDAVDDVATPDSNNGFNNWSPIDKTLSNCTMLCREHPAFVYSQPPVKRPRPRFS